MSVRPIKVAVFCATALATSTLASIKLKDEFKKHNIPCDITTGRISDMESMVSFTKPDVVIATAVSKMDIGVPIFSGIPLLSGIGIDGLVDEIIAYLKKQNLL